MVESTGLMLELDGYTLLKPLWHGPNSEVHLAVRDQDDRRVVLKWYRRDQSLTEDTRAERERGAMQRAAGRGVPAVYDLIVGNASPVLVIEYVAGIQLWSWAEAGPHLPQAFLTVAIQLAEILARVHSRHLIHRDVTPTNVVIDPATLETSLIDFGIAQPVGSVALAAPDGGPGGTGMAGTVKFMAPEQSGRMNRGVDARSDLYSVGATLYLAITGEPMFDLDDRLALIHAHMARMPRPPREVRPDIPEAISRILLKLLRKEPDERYQSAESLLADLVLCKEQLESRGEIDPDFEPGSADARGQPLFSRTLYGRDEVTALLRGHYGAAAAGELRVVAVHGEPGVGKSALVDGLRPEVARTGGYLACGRLDAGTGRPYAGLTAALSSLVEQLLVESDARVGALQEELRAGLGSLLPALVDLVPDLRFVVGEVAAPSPLGAGEARARLSLALQRFLRVCATPERPLVLFVDDLHCSEPESRFLLVDAVCQSGDVALLLVCACRTEEVSQGLASRAFVDTLMARGVAVDELTLEPLCQDSTARMLAEALRRDVDSDLRALAALVHRKTGGNPLLIQQFVEHIHAAGLLRFEGGARWCWDASEIAAARVPDGAVAFMTAKIERLDAKLSGVLEMAACIGGEFDAAVLGDLVDCSGEELEAALHTLSEAGLIAACRGGLRFVHERIREVAQSRIDPTVRARLHYETARLLIQRTPEDQRPERAPEIADHLNKGRVHLAEELRIEAVRLNHLASKKSLAAGAAATAEVQLGVGIELFRESDWAEHRPLGFQLLLDAAETALQCGEFERALERLAQLDERAPSRFEFTQIAVKRIQVYAVTETPETTATYMLKVLRRLGVRWPLHPSPLRAKLALRWVRWLLRAREGQEILRPARKVDLHWLAPILVLGQGGGVLIRHDTYLTALASCFVLRTYHKRGYIGRAPFSLASCANWLQVVLGDPVGARRISEAASRLNEKAPDPLYGPRSEMQAHAMLNPWLMRRRQPLARLDAIAESLSEMGDVEYAYYARFLKTCYLALAGVGVSEACELLRRLVDSVRRAALRYPEPETCQRAYGLLADAPSSEEIEAASAADDAWTREHIGWVRPYTRTLWLLVLCVYGRHDLAFTKSLRLAVLRRNTPYVHIADHTFYRGLSAAALATGARGRARSQYVAVLDECLRPLTRWARAGPDFVHMQLLLEAEKARLAGSHARAGTLFTKAAKRAEEVDFIHHAALAQERHGLMLIAERRFTQAAAGLSRAAAQYRAWGAHAKADSLERTQVSL